MSNPGGVRYSCAQCDYQATRPYILNIHVESLHEGIRYSCTKSDYFATEKESLRKRMKVKH